MAKKVYEDSYIAAIAAKIREKAGTTTTYNTQQMPSGIEEVYNKGHSVGHSAGKAEGYADGFAAGRAEGYAAGYADGYAAGLADGTPDEPAYTNVLLKAEAYDSTAIYNSVGYKADVRPSTSTGTGETACAGMYTTGYIPYNGQTTIRMKNMGFKTDSAQPNQCVIQAWSSKTVRATGSTVSDVAASSEYAPVFDGTAITGLTLPSWFTENCSYIRICCDYIGSDSVITLDEPIE